MAGSDVELVILTVRASLWEFAAATGVADADPPTLALPAATTVDATSPTGTVVDYVVGVTDAIDPSPVVSCAPTSGSRFAIGTTTVACTAADAAGNEASGSFTVTVRGAAEQFVGLVVKTIAYLSQPALEASLRQRLEQAAADLVANRKALACKGLNLYIAVIRLAPASVLNAAEKLELSGDANRIKIVIGCT